MLTIGLVVNPVAGLGGPAGLKGSDGAAIQHQARERGAQPQAQARIRSAFVALALALNDSRAGQGRPLVKLIAPAGEMGFAALAGTDFATGFAVVEDDPDDGAEPTSDLAETVVLSAKAPATETGSTTAADTHAWVKALLPQVDLLVFAGGDGTARDVLDAMQDTSHRVPVLGVPAGVKMHSGVFATSPAAAGALLHSLVVGGLVSANYAEVRDIDEAGLRRGEVGSRYYGELLVPAGGGYLQHVKSGGKEVEALVLLEIAADVAETLAEADPAVPLVLGPGSTCFAIKEHLLAAASGVANPTLLGVDVVHDGELLVADATRADLLALVTEYPELAVVLSYSRGQGFVLGRGNQQLGPRFLSAIPANSLYVVSSRTKLQSLDGRPLLVDTGEPALDQKFSGLTQIISGYQDKLLYLVQPA